MEKHITSTKSFSCESVESIFASRYKIGPLQELLEESDYRICDRKFMYDLIPFVVKEEEMQINDEIRNKHLGVIFDETTYTYEALVIFKVYE